MSPDVKIDEERGIISTCPKCKRMYWTAGYCSHGTVRPQPPKPDKPDGPDEPDEKVDRRRTKR